MKITGGTLQGYSKQIMIGLSSMWVWSINLHLIIYRKVLKQQLATEKLLKILKNIGYMEANLFINLILTYKCKIIFTISHFVL